MFAEVVLAKASRGIDKIYHYSIPEELRLTLKIGHQVRVPFGFRSEIGYVVGLIEQAEVSKVKDIQEITADIPLFTEQSVELAKWLAGYYSSFFITALRLVMPPGTRAKEGRKRKAKSKNVVSDNGNLSAGGGNVAVSGLTLTSEQRRALDKIKEAISAKRPEKFLLYGVTGSGKTEIYLQAIAEVIKRGKSAIVMVPEISLTPQLVERFRNRFQDHIAVLHSEFTEKQRVGEWTRVARGEASIVLGTRSAVFAPLKNLGLIVLDEEYETTYKSEKSPRYHAREVALKLAGLNNAVVIMGSATPAVETYYKANTGEYTKLDLPKRIDDRPLPPVAVVDMREEMKQKNFGVLSEKLKEELEKTLAGGEQAILFINRLGFFTFIMCRSCGYVIECPRCSVSLVYSSHDRQLRCNRCGFAREPATICPRCNSSSIKYFGTGTQRIEDEVAKLFPAARILRYDRETTGRRGSHELFFKTFAAGQADVMIGTQMVTKGLDLAAVTLVGVVSADIGLHLPDFRAGEHTFQLLTQVAGRAGRHHLPGKVIIQTYSPEHYVIKTAVNHDYQAFYDREIAQRQELGYPPFNKLISLLISGADQNKVNKVAADLADFINKRIAAGVLGPIPAVIPKLRGEWRERILLKGQDLNIMRKAVAETLAKAVVPREIKVTIDIEPLSLL
jgi:primosomal protein N' (replication factor Y) (superfamily II helicase)